MLKGNTHLDNYAQITKKQNENVSDRKTNSWQQKGSSTHPSTQVNKDVKIRINNSKGSEDYDATESTNVHTWSQTFASLTRGSIAEGENAIYDFFWTKTEKDEGLAKRRRSPNAWCAKKPRLTRHAVIDEGGGAAP